MNGFVMNGPASCLIRGPSMNIRHIRGGAGCGRRGNFRGGRMAPARRVGRGGGGKEAGDLRAARRRAVAEKQRGRQNRRPPIETTGHGKVADYSVTAQFRLVSVGWNTETWFELTLAAEPVSFWYTVPWVLIWKLDLPVPS